MEALKAILERRSARAFLDRKVEPALVEQLLAAGAHAPSAGGAEPWHFVVVDDGEALERIGRLVPTAEMAAKAPLGIAVCGDPTLERATDFWLQDCAAATENILLAAHALRLGAVWTGIHPARDRVLRFRQILELPTEVVPVSLVLVGYASRRLDPKDVSLEGRVHRNVWGAR
jgi:nitroreductase